MKQVGVVKAVPLAVEADLAEGLADLTFVLEDGDHLHVLVDGGQLQMLSQHIAAAAEKLREQKPRRR